MEKRRSDNPKNNLRRRALRAVLLAGAVLCCTAGFAQQYLLSGRVLRRNGEPIAYATVAEKGTGNGTYTAQDGAFALRVPGGEVTLEVRYVGYAPAERRLTVAHDIDSLTVRLDEQTLALDHIVVTARGIESREGTSAYRIGEQAIRQVQAMNLNDILSLLPGNELSTPDFDSPQAANLRTAAPSTANAFGTTIIVNGMALSNDANMQALNPSESLNGGQSPVGSGIDLRAISAAGIESVEVVTGVASPKYGNLTSGAVIVKNKKGASPLYVSANVNATSYQAAFSKGFELIGKQGGGTGSTFNVDASYTYSKDSPVARKNYYQNVSLGVRWWKLLDRAREWNNTLALQTYLGFNGQRYEPEETVRNEATVRNQNFNLSLMGDLKLAGGRLNYLFSGSLDNQYTHYNTIGTGPLPLVESLESGTFITSYSPIMYALDQQLEGLPVSLSADIGLAHDLHRGKWRMDFDTGVQYSYDKNFGRGRTVAGNVAATNGGIGARNAKFHEVPASKSLSLYHQTTIRRTAAQSDYQLRLGLRYDFMNERYHLFSPRLSASARFAERLRLRAAWGLAYKAPAMIQLYPGPAYYDYINLSHYATDPAERLAVVSTYVYQPQNKHLRPSRSDTREAGIDWEAPWLTVRATYYRRHLTDGIYHSPELLLLYRQNYEVVDRPAGQPPVVAPIEGDIDILVRTKYMMKNSYESLTDGFELMLIPARIERWHTEFQFQMSYMKTTETDHGYRMQLEKYVVGDQKARYGVYENPRTVTRHSAGSLTVTQQIPSLRLIFTLTAALNFTDYVERLGGSLYPYAYYDGEGVFHEIPEADRTSAEYESLKLPEATYEITNRPPFYANFHLQVRKETRAGHSFSLYAHNFLWYNPQYTYKGTRYIQNDRVNFGFAMSLRIGGGRE